MKFSASWEDGTMRKYLDENSNELIAVVCNECGKYLLVENWILKEGCFEADAVFGYFSKKDGQIHSFDLCEECYDKMVEKFAIPPEVIDVTEL